MNDEDENDRHVSSNDRECARPRWTCDLMRHLPAEQIEQILPCIRDREMKAGEILFEAGLLSVS
jgi:hypothetical protein